MTTAPAPPSARERYTWLCDCGHSYYTAANVPGMCPLHAAAPEMLAALEGLISPDGGVYATRDLREAAIVAIHKARGRKMGETKEVGRAS